MSDKRHKRPLKKTIKAKHRRRFRLIKEIGCLLCKLDAQDMTLVVPCDVHHIVVGGRRISHDYTIGACPHRHHRCKEFGSVDGYGVEEEYGLNEDDLIHVQDALINLHESRTIGATVTGSAKGWRPRSEVVFERPGPDATPLDHANALRDYFRRWQEVHPPDPSTPQMDGFQKFFRGIEE